MGEHCAVMAAEWGIGREEQDELTVRSHHDLAAAYERGFMDDLVDSYLGLERDQNLRPDSSTEKLAKLGPVFGGEDGTMTAANSTPLSDGASAVLLASEEWAKERDLPILAYFVDGQTAAIDHVHKREGLLMAPAYAMPRMLDRNGLGLRDFDLYEIHEAFAAQVLCTLRAWEDERFCRDRLGREEPLGAIDRDKLNVNGGSLAAGHPFAATGGRIVASLAKELHERGSGRGAISICAAAGQGVVAILEAPGKDGK
jgi:acetyl-CoA C-acetyltransferase